MKKIKKSQLKEYVESIVKKSLNEAGVWNTIKNATGMNKRNQQNLQIKKQTLDTINKWMQDSAGLPFFQNVYNELRAAIQKNPVVVNGYLLTNLKNSLNLDSFGPEVVKTKDVLLNLFNSTILTNKMVEFDYDWVKEVMEAILQITYAVKNTAKNLTNEIAQMEHQLNK